MLSSSGFRRVHGLLNQEIWMENLPKSTETLKTRSDITPQSCCSLSTFGRVCDTTIHVLAVFLPREQTVSGLKTKLITNYLGNVVRDVEGLCQ